MKKFKIFLMALFIVGAPLALGACDNNDSPIENAVQDVEEGVEEVKDEIDDATTN